MADEPHILRLPNEVLLQIFKNLRATRSSVQLPHLWSLCLVSKKLLPIAQEELYAGAFLKTACGCHDVVNAVIMFLRTILERPELAPKVKILRFNCINRSVTKLYRQKDYALEPIRKACLTRLEELGHNSELGNAWKTCLTKNVESAYAGVLLTLLPNLETLRFSVKELAKGPPCIEPLSALFGNPAIALKHLQPLRDNISYIDVIDIGFLRDVGFKHLKKLDLGNINSNMLARIQGPGTIKSGITVEDLSISTSTYVAEVGDPDLMLSLADLFGALGCTRLKSLKILLHDDGHFQCPALHFSPNQLIEAIQPVSENLRVLDISFEKHEDPVDMTWFLDHCVHPAWTWDELTCLEYLRVPQHFLICDEEDIDSEPKDLSSSLKRLDILYPDKLILKWMKKLYRIESAHFPDLETICLECRADVSIRPKVFTKKPSDIWADLHGSGIECLIIEDLEEDPKNLHTLWENYIIQASDIDKDDIGDDVKDTDDKNDDDKDDDGEDGDAGDAMDTSGADAEADAEDLPTSNTSLDDDEIVVADMD